MYIQKSSGRSEPFNPKKLKQSLVRAGAKEDIAEHIAQEVYEKNPRSSAEIYEHSFQTAYEHDHALGLHYNMRRAVQELGPSGFPFEQFVAGVMRALGWKTKTNVILDGKCVRHEIDVLMHKENEEVIMECKFRNMPGSKVDVKVPMYFKSRLEDVTPVLKQHEKKQPYQYHTGMVATNTKFTRDAIRFAECNNIALLGWGYPEQNNLQQAIEKAGIAPITVLPHLTMQQKQYLAKKGVVLCHQLPKKVHFLKHLGLSKELIKHILDDVHSICKNRKRH